MPEKTERDADVTPAKPDIKYLMRRQTPRRQDEDFVFNPYSKLHERWGDLRHGYRIKT